MSKEFKGERLKAEQIVTGLQKTQKVEVFKGRERVEVFDPEIEAEGRQIGRTTK